MTITKFGFTGTVGEVERAKMDGAFAGAGIIGTYNDGAFAATRAAGIRNMNIAAGTAWVPGVLVISDASAQAGANASANATGNPRIDIMVWRVKWSDHTAVLAIVEGTAASNPQPPALANNPGVLVEMPVRQAVLASGASEYSDAAIAAGDCRVWLEDGQMLQASAKVLPALTPGQSVFQPNTGHLLLKAASGLKTFRAWEDTGFVDLAMTPPQPYAGKVIGRKLNGVATIYVEWTKKFQAQGETASTPAALLPAGWRPTTSYLPFSGWRNNIPLRFGAYSNGQLAVGPVLTEQGDILRCTLSYPVEPEPEA